MRRLTAIAFVLFIVTTAHSHAADPRQLFGSILGELGRQIEQQQQKKLLKRLKPLWEACARGDVTACDRAASFPNLTNQARRQIGQMREAAEQRPAYERNFYACQKMDVAACDAALAYQYASDVDRANLRKWRFAAGQRRHQQQQVLERFRQAERRCYAGSIAACDAALAAPQSDARAVAGIRRHRTELLSQAQQRRLKERQRQQALARFQQAERRCYTGSISACETALAQDHLDVGAVARIRRQRAQLLHDEQARKLKERQRQQALAEFRGNQRRCYAGTISACEAALAQRHLDQHAAIGIQRQRDQLQRAEQQRLAAVREYNALREGCVSGKRLACKRALAHAQLRQGDTQMLKRRDRELAPLKERVINFVAGASMPDNIAGVSLAHTGLGVLGILGFCGVVMVARGRLASGSDAPGENSQEPPVLEPEPAVAPLLELTGHMPTDVRRALYGT